MTVAFDVVLIVVGLTVLGLSSVKWLRVAQREHYIPSWVSRITWLWIKSYPVAFVFAVLFALLACGWGFVFRLAPDPLQQAISWVAVPLVAVELLFPLGLRFRGSSSRLAWTGRLKRLAVAWAVLVLLVDAVFTLLLGPASVGIVVLLLPVITDVALNIMAPIEKRASRRFVLSAKKRLDQVRPKVVAITGSYGKTSTKNYVAHLLEGSFGVLASPASFNNLLGLSRAVNDRVVPGTEVFVAEMGVYGPGEIRELSSYFPPDIAAITTIGEAHLQRMGSREVIFQAKSEIVERASTVVLPVDEDYLSELAARCAAEGKRVVTVSVHPEIAADVVVDAVAGTVTVGADSAPVTISGVGHAINVAIAVGIALALGVELKTLAPRLGALPDSHHRAEIQQAPNGLVVIDDTYNSNPVGAQRALEGAAALAAERGGELVVVTPGMVELGHVQYERNRAFARSVAAAGGSVFAVALTNRRALRDGAAEGGKPARVFPTRAVAVAAALDQAADRGVILYENDLPDHFP